jgi:hypothetical protein
MRWRSPLLIAFGIAVGALALVDCGSPRLAHPRYVGHPTSALIEVPYPPPPARVEYVPDPPQSGAVWVDGEWSWRGRRWAWRSGRWVIVPPDAAFSPWTSVRNGDGTLYFAPGTWRNAKGEELRAPQALALGSASPGSVVDPEGDIEPTGRNLDDSDVGDGGIRHRTRLPGSSNVNPKVTSGEAGVGSPADTTSPSKPPAPANDGGT